MNFIEGEVLLVDKPLTWTSFQVVNKLRYLIRKVTGKKNIKVGHAGTLDPLADGLLIICTGKKTKSIDSFMGLPKTYTGTITLGGTTPSFDLETQINETFEITSIHEKLILDQAKKMIGDQLQMPPIFSAKRINGDRAYDLARAGEEVKLTAKPINISSFEITGINLPHLKFNISCSKGTYIRSVAHDFGKGLNNGAHLSSLRREQIGEYNVKNAWNLDDLVNHLNKLITEKSIQ